MRSVLPSFFLLSALVPVGAWAASQCAYEPVPGSLSVGFTGYKTTQKVGVKGKFVSSKDVGKARPSYHSLESLLSSVHIETDLSSVDSGNPLRDQNLKTAFFGILKKGPMASARLSQIEVKPDNSGSAVMKLEFNGKSGKVPVTFTMDKAGAFQLKGTTDITAFNGQDSLNSLNTACKDLHKGPDGVSKTWSDVEIWATAQINVNCAP